MRLIVHIPTQTLDVMIGHRLISRHVISTSQHGTGTEPGSNRTPTGKFRIAEKIGDGQPAGMIFISRVPTGNFGKEEDEHDHVQTRILWLDGLEPHNANTKDRYIYIHGTNAESKLGIPASHGCVRMNNAEIIELYDLVKVGTEVEIIGYEDAC